MWLEREFTLTPEVAALLAHARAKLEAARVLDAQRIVDAVAEHLSR